MDVNRNTLYGFAAIILWSTTIALSRSLSEQIGPLTTASGVFLCSGAFCLGWMFRSKVAREGARGQSRLYLLGCGGLFVLYMFSLFLAIGLASTRYQVLEIGLVNYLWPTFTIIFSLLILNKRFHLPLVPATLLALVGIFLVMTEGSSISWGSFSKNLHSNPTAYVLAFVAAVSWGLYSNLARRWADPEGRGAVQLFIPVTGIILLGLRLVLPEEGSWTARAVGEALILSLATTAAYIFWDIAMRKGDVVLVASGSYFTPLLSTLVSCIYLGVTAGLKVWVGCVLIVAGAIVSRASISD
jgi:drug/metabolite transporter (DMT)-like permease